MTSRKLTLQVQFTGNAAEAIADLTQQLQGLESQSEGTEEALKKTESLTSRFESTVSKSTDSVDAANRAIKLLQREVTDGGLAYQEAAQKILDAQRKLSEFGASAGEQSAALDKIQVAINDLGISGTKAAAVMEELAIEFNDGSKAVQLYDRALKFAEGSTKRTEDAVADFADAVKGGTSGLTQYGRRMRGVAEAIDNISDPALRAKKATEALEKAQKQAGKTGDTQTKIMDSFALAQLKLAEQGPLVVGALKATATAAAAAAAAFTAFTVSAVQEYIEATPQLKQRTDEVASSFDNLQKSFGEAVLGDIDSAAQRIDVFDKVLDDITATVKEYTPEIQTAVDGTLAVVDALAQFFAFGFENLPLFHLVDLFTLWAGVSMRNTIAVPLGFVRDALEAVGLEVPALNSAIDSILSVSDVLENIDLSGAAGDVAGNLTKITEGLNEASEATLNFDDSVKTLDTNLRKLSEIDLETALDPLATLAEFTTQLGGQPRSTGQGELISQRELDKKAREEAKRRREALAAAKKEQEELRKLRERDALASVDSIVDEVDRTNQAASDRLTRLAEAQKRTWAGVADEIRRTRGLALAVDQDAITETTPSLGSGLFGRGGQAQDTGEGAAGGLFSDKALEEFNDKSTSAEATAKRFQKTLKEVGLTGAAAGQMIANGLVQAGSALGAAVVQGESLGTAIGVSLLSSMGSMLTTVGAQMAAAGAAFLLAPGLEATGAGWIAGGIGVAAAGGALSAAAGLIGGSASTQGGGTVSGGGQSAGAAGGGGIQGNFGVLSQGFEEQPDRPALFYFEEGFAPLVGRVVQDQRRRRAFSLR